MPQAIHISPIDNVVVALHPIAKGTLVEVDGLAVTALEDIPQGHKMAVTPIKNGENVIRYGFPIGHATADAQPGTWMHTHNVHTNLSGEVEYSYNLPDLAPPAQGRWSRRPSWASAARMARAAIPMIRIIPTGLRQRHRQEDGGRQPGPGHWLHRGLYTITHPFGCSGPAMTMHRPANCWLRWCATPMLPLFWCFPSAART